MSAHAYGKPQTIVGIDPGKGGGIAGFGPATGFWLFGMPETESDIVEALAGHCKPAVAYVEKLPMGHLNANVSSMAKLHRNGGLLVGVLLAYGWRVIEVPPQGWQSHFGLGSRGTYGARWKAHIKDVAQKLHPGVEGITLKTADALMLLAFGLAKEGIR
jgi:hypothetical protein